MKKWQKRVLGLFLGVVLTLLLLAGGFYLYTKDYYRGNEEAQRIFSEKGQVIGKGLVLFEADSSKNKEIGLIFYPGAKVEAVAYAPLLSALAKEGITTVLLEMPFNLAVLDSDKANEAILALPRLKVWYLAGHSLGGAMAGSYANTKEYPIEGLILLAAYTQEKTEIPTLSIYGSEDKILDRNKISKYGQVLELQGGNHAGFGYYGPQKGDGQSSITREEQQAQTLKAILQFIVETQPRFLPL